MFGQGVARLELQLARVVPNPQNNGRPKSHPLDPAREPRKPLLALIEETQLELWFNRAFRKNDVGLQEISNVVLHELEGAFCLRPVEGEAELVEAMIGQVEFPEQPLRNPPAAVVGSQRMIFDHQHVDVRLLDHDLAVGNQNAEVRDGSLRPLLEPFGDQFLVLGVDGIELSVFGRTAGADETILPAFVAHAHQDLADPGLLVRVQKAARYLHREDADLRMNRE